MSTPCGIELAPGIVVPESAIQIDYAASRGPGGQNVNKKMTKAQLRIAIASIPIDEPARLRLAKLAGSRVTTEGEILISADENRSQERNASECMARLRELIVRAMTRPKVRRKTKPSRGSIERRLQGKKERSRTKSGRRSVGDE